jgi:hypothetical protein
MSIAHLKFRISEKFRKSKEDWHRTPNHHGTEEIPRWFGSCGEVASQLINENLFFSILATGYFSLPGAPLYMSLDLYYVRGSALLEDVYQDPLNRLGNSMRSDY